MTVQHVYRLIKYAGVATYCVCAWTLVSWFRWILLNSSLVVFYGIGKGCGMITLAPTFADPVPNLSVPLGRDASFPCVVDYIREYKVAWLKVETKAILSIHQHLITRNYRILISSVDNRQFVLHIKDVRESDRGGYMCQINTLPMMSQTGYLEILVPPGISEAESSSDMKTREGDDVALTCKANGRPLPNVTWRREDGNRIPLTSVTGEKFVVTSYFGEDLNISRISRLHMGAYLCIASNCVPPSVSRRIVIDVEFPPVIWVPTQMLGRRIGEDVTLACHVEGHPTPVNTWVKDLRNISTKQIKYNIEIHKRSYKLLTTLTIKNLQMSDFGVYGCVAENNLGKFEGKIKIYELPFKVTQVVNNIEGHETDTRKTNNYSTDFPVFEQTHRKEPITDSDSTNDSVKTKRSRVHFAVSLLLHFGRQWIKEYLFLNI
ncbi:lachesin-like [Tachypleus tridentatus]|uniref:lachesin-like n=1 Tax=Tachypleus tridentatus TaxID=6853 RepID=UPI003FD19273